MKHPLGRSALMTFCILVGAIGLIAATAPRQPARIGVVDTDRITNDSKMVQESISKASVHAQAIRDEIETRTKDFQEKKEIYASQEAVSGEKVNGERVEELKRLKEILEELNFKLNREIKKAQEQAVDPIRETILQAVREVAAAQDLDAVLSTEALLHFNPRNDITGDIIEHLDASVRN